jgi:hypothetical protein
MSLKWQTVLNSMMKSAVLFLPAQDVNHHFVQHIHTVYTTCLLVI